MKALQSFCLIMLIVGSLNWGLVGLFNFDLVFFIFGSMTIFSRIIYTLVGLSALVMLYINAKINNQIYLSEKLY